MAFESKSLESCLPSELIERSECIREGDLGEGPVVYWMHRALRLEENPALEVAVKLSESLGKELALVAELSTERDPYASARHWTFELEGLTQLQAQVERYGGNLTLVVESDSEPGSRYHEILQAAGLLVVEDLPVASERSFRKSLEKASQVPIVAVDASCIVPMNLTKKTIRRAFAFRERYKDLIDSAVWAPEPAPLDLGGVNWSRFPLVTPRAERSEISSLVANAPIDHAIAPVGELRGGREAGLERWHNFVQSRGLKRYAKRRNDALLEDGVSRMSAYLHYGFVSPFELARAAQSSEKYVDELVVWRELAWHYCHRVPNHDAVDCLPDWALQSLRNNLESSPNAPSFLALWNAETDDAFWNACQRSLRVTGELHNNVRMTWGKALVSWSRSPEEALLWLTELNHRFALDGNDPASYGGLLWCLGEFDRPFKPAKPIWGEVRDRSTDIHAKRCPPEGLNALVDQRNIYAGHRVGIVGAGVSGLAAAATLKAHGVAVTLWDKGFNPGGRVARRPTDDGGGIEHGTSRFSIEAQHLQSQRLREFCQDWAEFAALESSAQGDHVASEFHGRGNLQGWLRALSSGTQLCTKTPVRKLSPLEREVRVDGTDGELGRFDALLSTVPAPQMIDLVDDSLKLALRALDEVAYAPSIVVAAAWVKGTQPSPTKMQDWLGGGVAVEQQGPLGLSTWTIEAPASWSEKELERSKDALAEDFKRKVSDAGYPAPEILWAHRWKYARVIRPLGLPFWEAATAPIFWTGDGALGGGIEGAWYAGQRAATGILARLREAAP